MKSYVYLHGFASSPASRKAQFFASRLAEHGVTLQIPELDSGDFEHLTLTGQLEILHSMATGHPLVLIGSSLGGYLAALYAELHSEVEKLLLLAPAFDFRRRWADRLGAETMTKWKEQRALPVYHYGTGRERFIGYSLMEDAERHAPYPDVRQPVLLMQGTRDDVVLPEVAQTFCDYHANATLCQFESGHELTDVLEEIWMVAEPFLLHE